MSQQSTAAAGTIRTAGSAGVPWVWRRYWLGLLVAAAFLPTLAGIFMQGPEYDESIVMLTVSGHTGPVWPREPVLAGQLQGMFADRANLPTLLSDIRETDVHPPLHYVAAWLVHLVAGPSLPVQRLLSLAALAGALILLLRQWRRDSGEDVSATVVFAVIFALSPASYYAGSTARGYALVMLFLTVAYVALRGLADDRAATPGRRGPGLAALVGSGTGLAVLTHYLAAVPAAVLGISALTLLATRRDWRSVAALCGAAAVPALASAWFLLNQMETRGGFAPLPFPGFGSLLAQTIGSLFLRMPAERLPLPAAAYAMSLVATATAVALFGTALSARQNRNFTLFWLPVAVVALHVAGLVLQQWVSGARLSQPRYLTLVWPFAAIVLARGALWYGRRFAWGLAVPALLVTSYALLIGLALYSMPGEPFKDIVGTANAARGRSILMIDRGYGRGIPAPIVLAAPPDTRLWIVTPQMLEGDLALTALNGDNAYDEIHAVLSVDASSREAISRWLDRLPDRSPFVEHDTNIYLHRYFVRRPSRN